MEFLAAALIVLAVLIFEAWHERRIDQRIRKLFKRDDQF